MKIKKLSIIKNITAWGGIIITLIGIGYSLYIGGDIWSSVITLIGVILSGAGHLIGVAESNQQQREKDQMEYRLKDMDKRIKEAHDRPATFS